LEIPVTVTAEGGAAAPAQKLKRPDRNFREKPPEDSVENTGAQTKANKLENKRQILCFRFIVLSKTASFKNLQSFLSPK
jgi:hypothetical protein